MICAYCEANKSPSKEDEDFCQECFDEIQHNTETQMERVVAARAWFAAKQNTSESAQMFAFLSIFYPAMPWKRRWELSRK